MSTRITVGFSNFTVGSVKARRLRRRSFLMTRQRRKNRPTVIHHTSMVSRPETVDLCSTSVRELPSCIDLTNDTDENEIVDLTSANDSVVCLDTASELPASEQQTRRKQRNHHTADLGQAINIDSVEDGDSSASDVLPVFDCGNRCLNVKKTEETAKKKITCSVCYDDAERIEKSGRQLVSTICGHLFCDDCIRDSIRVHRCCPNCRKKLTVKQFHPIFI